MTVEWQTKLEMQGKEWQQKLNTLEQKMKKQDETIQMLGESIKNQVTEVIGKALQGDAGIATKAEMLKGQYKTKQELEKIKDQINGVMESDTTMIETIGKTFDAMT